MNLINFLSIPIKCASITIMVYKDTYMIKDKEYDTFEYHITLKHTHKRLDHNVNKLVEEFGYAEIRYIEWREDGDLLLKIK